MQLRSQNTDSLKLVATKWIDEANQGESVWNAFLVGNVEQISEAIRNWHKTLKEYSEPRMSNETIRGNDVLSFDENSKSIEAATQGIDSLKEIYTKTTGVKLNTIWTGIIIFLMLLFPYFLQKRNTRAEGLYFLLPGTKAKSYTKITSSCSKNGSSEYGTDEKTDSKTTDGDNKSANDDIFGGTF